MIPPIVTCIQRGMRQTGVLEITATRRGRANQSVRQSDITKLFKSPLSHKKFDEKKFKKKN